MFQKSGLTRLLGGRFNQIQPDNAYLELAEQIERLQARIAELETQQSTGSDQLVRSSVTQALEAVRAEYTSLPRFAYHLPLDYQHKTLPPRFDPPVMVDGEPLPLPPPAERHGLVTDDALYLDWGRYDHDVVLHHIRQHIATLDKLSVMDFGCSSGRILRHFYKEMKELDWRLSGVDVSARHIEWLRRHFPVEFQVYTGSILPIVPFESGSFDVIYGQSVFTHLKFLWDMWLLELRRVLKPGGVLIQTIHTEHAWNFFYQRNQESEWKAENFGGLTITEPNMPDDFVYFGNIDNNNIFWKSDVALTYWQKYFRYVIIYPPPDKYNYQSWVVSIK